MLTIKEILDYIEEHHNETDWMNGYPEGDIPGATFKSVEEVGGEGEGETYYTVWEFRDERSNHLIGYVKFDGWYASFSGAEFTSMFEVHPKEKTITVYE